MIEILDKHYKDRKPEETIKIIFQFFKNKKLKISIDKLIQNESGTWSATVSLKTIDNKLISKSYGKGLTKKYCIASGYAEMYERFCNKVFFIDNPFVCQKVIEQNYQLNGYYFDKNEKILTEDEAFIDKIKNLKPYQNFFNKTCNNQYIGVPFKNINKENDIKYYDLRLLYPLQFSVGMSAGNTLEEALNQGLSELCEWYVTENIAYKDINLKNSHLYILNNKKINNKNLQNIIKKIEKEKNKVYIIDCSYEFNLPVLLVVIVNLKTQLISMNFGSFPVFDIALERVLTEVYQGIKSLNEIDNKKSFLMNPWRSKDLSFKMYSSIDSIASSNFFNENILFDLKYQEEFNKNIFLKDNNYSNEEILNYYKNIFTNLNCNIYYYNSSNIKNFYSLYIYINPLLIPEFKILTLKNNDNIENYCFILNNLYDFYKEYLTSKIINFQYLNNIIKYYNLYNDDNYIILSTLQNNLFVSPYYYANLKGIVNIIIELLIFNNSINTDYLYWFFRNTFYEPYLKKYLTLFNYVNCQKYINNEIIQYFNLFNIKITQEEIDNIENIEFLIEKIFLEPYYNELNNEDFLFYI